METTVTEKTETIVTGKQEENKKEEKNEPERIELREVQEPHFDRLCNILQQRHFCFDNTIMGGGKTVIHLYLAYIFRLKILAICPVSAQMSWQREAKKYGIEIVDLITYRGLASQTDYQPKHGYLERYDGKTETGKKAHPEFIPTQKLKDLIDKGVYIIFDEYQSVRKKNQAYHACSAMARCVLRSTKSRFALLSGTPVIEKEHTVNLLKFAGIIKSYQLYVYHKNTRTTEYKGVNDLIDYCTKVNPAGIKKYLDENPLPNKASKAIAIEICHKIYVNVLMRYVRSAAPSPEIDVKLDIKNGYYKLPAENQQALHDALARMEKDYQFDDKDANSGSYHQRLIFAWTKESVVIEEAKIPIFLRLTLNILMSVSGSKVIIMLNHLGTVDVLKEKLKDYQPLILTGEVKEDKKHKDRTDLVDKFNQSKEHRVLIGTSKVMAESLNLQDTVGDSPRFILYSPNFYADRTHQASKRTHRDGAKSNCTFRNIYGTGCKLETRILNKLVRTSPNMKDVLPEQLEEGIVFPSDYQEEHEDPQAEFQLEKEKKLIGITP